jgi:hypothetical protein
MTRVQRLQWWTAMSAVLAHGCVITLSTTAPGTSGSTVATAGAEAGTEAGTGDGGGAPVSGSWSNVTSNLANLSSECGNMAGFFAKPDEDLLIAGIALRGLWGSRDGGNSWQALSADAGAANITNRPRSIVFDPNDSMKFWESGIYDGAGVFLTTNDGLTFAPLGMVMNSDLVSVDLSDPNRQTLVAGGHEQSQTLYRSTNGGMTWTNVGAGLPGNTNCTFPLVISAQVHLVGCGGYGGGPSGVYLTADGGGTWKAMTTAGGSGAPLLASDASIYWAAPNAGGLTRSTDSGQHWTQTVGPQVVSSVSPIELPDGRLATIGAQSAIVVSADHGVSWKPVTTTLPYTDAVGLVYSQQRKAFYIWHFTCGFSGPVPVPADAIMSFDFDYQQG